MSSFINLTNFLLLLVYYRGHKEKKTAAFRGMYSEIGDARTVLPLAAMVGLTATAPPRVVMKVKESLCMEPDCLVVQQSAHKKNLRLVIGPCNVKFVLLMMVSLA